MARDRVSPVEFYESEIAPRLTVADVYGGVEFKQRGRRYWRGPCPLHKGTDPNFSVDTETLGWTCFSTCGHGSALAFLNGGETPRGPDFVALVRDLAHQIGVDTSPLDAPRRPEDDERHAREVHRETLWEAFFTASQAALATDTGQAARRYLAGRGFTDDEQRDAGFGVYTTPDAVAATLAAKEFARDALLEAGLLDARWTGRLIVPWRDRWGHARTCAARDLSGASDGAKYLYPTGTTKADLVAFGLDVALRSGRHELVLVEGLLDVVLLQARGVLNVAAIGGGGGEFSSERWAALERFGVRRVTLVLDNDEAGRTGTRAALDHARKVPLRLTVDVVDPVLLSPYKDPDELVRATGVEAFRHCLEQTVPKDLYVGRTFLAGVGPDSPVAVRQKAADDTLAFVATLPEISLDRADLIVELGERTGYPDAVLKERALEQTRRHEKEEKDRAATALHREAAAALAKGDLPAYVETLRAGLARLTVRTGDTPPPFSVDRLVERSKHLAAGRPSGWATLDDETGLGLRFEPGELALLAARTGHGKTSVLTGLVKNWISGLVGDELVVFYSTEEAEERIFHRLVALFTLDEGPGKRWTANAVRDYLRNPLSRDEWPYVPALDAALARLRAVEDHLLVVSRPAWTVGDLDAHARTVAAAGRPLVAVFVDYLQRVPPDGTGYDRRDIEVSAVARRLKALAADLTVPVIVGAQINRVAVQGNTVPRKAYDDKEVQSKIRDRRPRLEHLREGGSEQEADLVLGLLNYRADYEEDADDARKAAPYTTKFEIGVLKSRYGAPGRWAALAFEGKYHALRDPRDDESL